MTINPFSILSESVSPLIIQLYVILMIFLVILGTLFDIIHKKNVKYFFQNAKKSREQAKRSLSKMKKLL